VKLCCQQTCMDINTHLVTTPHTRAAFAVHCYNMPTMPVTTSSAPAITFQNTL